MLRNRVSKKSLINSMKCFAFQYALDRWEKTSKEVLKIFKKGKVFEYIKDNYEYLHINGYEFILDDIEEYLTVNKIKFS